MAKPPSNSRSRRQWRTRILVVRQFQYRYAIFLATAGLFASAIVAGLTIWVLDNNYETLIRTELIHAPRMVDGLYLEAKLVKLMVVSAFVGFVVFLAMMGVKFSHRIVVPIYLIQEKMKELCRGDLNNARVHIRKSDEFQELAESYNYLVESLRTQVKMDIHRLKGLKPDEQNRDAFHLWETLLSEKNAQLSGAHETSSPDPHASSRHAS